MSDLYESKKIGLDSVLNTEPMRRSIHLQKNIGIKTEVLKQQHQQH